MKKSLKNRSFCFDLWVRWWLWLTGNHPASSAGEIPLHLGGLAALAGGGGGCGAVAAAGGLRVVRGEEDLAAQHQALERRKIYRKLICSLLHFVGTWFESEFIWEKLRKWQPFIVSFLANIILELEHTRSPSSSEGQYCDDGSECWPESSSSSSSGPSWSPKNAPPPTDEVDLLFSDAAPLSLPSQKELSKFPLLELESTGCRR